MFMHDFHSILIDYGFSTDSYDFESTIIGFDYDIHFSLFDNNSTVFDIDQCRIYRQWNCPNALVRCELISRNGNIEAAVKFFYDRWLSELRYENPELEIIDIRQHYHFTSVHILTISKRNAITLLLNFT